MTTDIFKLERGWSHTHEVGRLFWKRWQTDVTYTFVNLTYQGHLGKMYYSDLTENEIRKICDKLGFEFSDYRKPHIYVNDKNVHNLENLCKNLVRLNIEKQNEYKVLCIKNDEEIKLINEIEQKNIAAMQLKDVYCGKLKKEENDDH